ncbi:hypothetical protein KKD37_01505 [Patescibacteria group bacterium]|nr:hypothetical protein [Patescibacteria group bacterium]
MAERLDLIQGAKKRFIRIGNKVGIGTMHKLLAVEMTGSRFLDVDANDTQEMRERFEMIVRENDLENEVKGGDMGMLYRDAEGVVVVTGKSTGFEYPDMAKTVAKENRRISLGVFSQIYAEEKFEIRPF